MVSIIRKIQAASKVIGMSWFLFEHFYAFDFPPNRNTANEMTFVRHIAL